jgi:hypothetical protein
MCTCGSSRARSPAGASTASPDRTRKGALPGNWRADHAGRRPDPYPAASDRPAATTRSDRLNGYVLNGGGIRSTVHDVAAFYHALFTGKLLPKAEVAAMEDTTATHGAYGLGLMTTGGNAYVWGPLHPGDQHHLRPRLGPRRQLPRLLPTADLQPRRLAPGRPARQRRPIPDPASQLKQIYHVLDIAYCEESPPRRAA